MIIKIENGVSKGVLDETSFRRAHPEVSFPKNLTDELLREYGYANLHIPSPPDQADGTRIDKGDVEFVEGRWQRGWVVVDLPMTTSDVKREAARRIIEILPEWKQRNLIAQASILAEKGRSNWSAAELAAWDAGTAYWAQIEAVRSASGVIEAMDPIPRDFADDKHWPAT